MVYIFFSPQEEISKKDLGVATEPAPQKVLIRSAQTLNMMKR